MSGSLAPLKRKFWPRVKRKNFKVECLCAWDNKPMRYPRKNQLYCSQVCKQRAFQLRKDLKNEDQTSQDERGDSTPDNDGEE